MSSTLMTWRLGFAAWVLAKQATPRMAMMARIMVL